LNTARPTGPRRVAGLGAPFGAEFGAEFGAGLEGEEGSSTGVAGEALLIVDS
jgi:hypothetical protein